MSDSVELIRGLQRRTPHTSRNINSFVYDYVHINVKRSMRCVDGACCC